MNSRVNPEYLEIQSLLEGLEVACFNDSLYVTLRLARQASDIFRVITGSGCDESTYDVFDVMAMLKGAQAHDETTGAQRAIIAVAIDALEALAVGPNNPGDLPTTSVTTSTSEADFMAGVFLGNSIAVDGRRVGRNYCFKAHLLRECRQDEDGTVHDQQDNFALSAVRELVKNPALAEGFAAALSDQFGHPEVVTTTYKAEDLTYAAIIGAPKPAKALKKAKRTAAVAA
jgi:hypothetical protein